MLPDITELEYVRKEETRPRVGDTNPPKLGGEVTSEPEGVDISQDEEDTGHQDGIDLSGRPSPCVVEHIKIEEFQEEENPVARNEDAASNDESRPGRTEDHEVDELLKEGNVFPKESHDQNQKKRNKRKSSPKSPKRKKQKSALDVESNPDQPPLLSQKEGEVEEEDVLSCEMCGQLFPETEEFSRHIETDHDHQCQEDGCGLSFTHEYYLHLHEADEHPTGPPSPPNNSFGQAERWIRSGRNIQLNKFKQYKVSIISFSCFSSPIAVERMKNVMNGRRNSLRHELFLDKRERERCSGNETSRLYQLSNPGYLGGGGEKDTIVIKQLIETVFVKYFNQADSKLKKLGHKIAFDYTSCVLFPETFIHQLQVKINN